MAERKEMANGQVTKRLTKTKYRNFPMVPRVIFGRGSFSQLGNILISKRKSVESPYIFLVDDYFESNPIEGGIPKMLNDEVIYISALNEPTTDQVDRLAKRILDRFQELPSGIIGIGGGTVLDLAKAVSIMAVNKGSASKYQGWDLVNIPALYHVGVPTISGTGAEVSRTAVLSGPEKKLGINSDFTTFDQVVLDPTFLSSVPLDQRFYTGMDCFIHCIESLNGHYLNSFSQSYGEKALELCKEVFLGNRSRAEADEKLMMASWHGGMSIAYSQVGVAHAMSYGMSYVLGTHHGIGNCIVFQHLRDYYPEGVRLFKEMKELSGIKVPTKICSILAPSELEEMAKIAYSMTPLWENALGNDWQDQISIEDLILRYREM